AIAERERLVVAPGEDRLGAETLAEQPGEPPRDGERHLLLDDIALGAGIVSAVAGVDDDLRRTDLPRACECSLLGALAARPLSRRRDRDAQLETARRPADPIAAGGAELQHDAHDTTFPAADAQHGHGSTERQGPRHAAGEAGTPREVDVDPRHRARRDGNVVNGHAYRLRQAEAHGRATGTRL